MSTRDGCRRALLCRPPPEPVLESDLVPKLAVGVRLRFDEVRKNWVLLAPESLFQPDEIALEVLNLIDGQRCFEQIIDALAQRYDAPRPDIAADVSALLEQLHQRGVLEL